jgi:multisubunit Na+/H+ antiporter MnhC subunit
VTLTLIQHIQKNNLDWFDVTLELLQFTSGTYQSRKMTAIKFIIKLIILEANIILFLACICLLLSSAPTKRSRDMEMPGVRPLVRPISIFFVIGALEHFEICCVLATILKIAAKMATIMAAMAAIFKSHLSLSHSSGRKSSKYQFSLPNFELKQNGGHFGSHF